MPPRSPTHITQQGYRSAGRKYNPEELLSFQKHLFAKLYDSSRGKNAQTVSRCAISGERIRLLFNGRVWLAQLGQLFVSRAPLSHSSPLSIEMSYLAA